MNRNWIFLGCTLAALSLPASLEAWDSLGHQVVTQIAWENMTQPARDRAVALLKAAPADADLASLSDDGRELFLLASTWPDIVRSREKPERQARYHHGSWHYINLHWEQPDPASPPRDREDLKPAQENAVERLKEFEKVLASSEASDADKAVALAWVLHLVGDLHQPLHASNRVTPTEPEGDRGGGLFKLAGDDLHWYWDSILQKIWFSRGLGDTELAAEIADEFMRQIPEDESRLKKRDYDAWAQESFAKTKSVVYGPELKREEKPSREYRWRVYNTAKPAMALAGYRLAEMLNAVLGGS
jgi:hypothetical protein